MDVMGRITRDPVSFLLWLSSIYVVLIRNVLRYIAIPHSLTCSLCSLLSRTRCCIAASNLEEMHVTPPSHDHTGIAQREQRLGEHPRREHGLLRMSPTQEMTDDTNEHSMTCLPRSQ